MRISEPGAAQTKPPRAGENPATRQSQLLLQVQDVQIVVRFGAPPILSITAIHRQADQNKIGRRKALIRTVRGVGYFCGLESSGGVER